MAKGDPVHIKKGSRPRDYHCSCAYCRLSLGELIKPDGTNYSRHERREYYDKTESGKGGHVAKTPLHIARWAVQTFTETGDWVLDPTIGAGTTAVEAITQGRNVAGMELQFEEALRANVTKNLTDGVQAEIRIGDARRIGAFLDDLGKSFQLIVNNPPYSGDEHLTSFVEEGSKYQCGPFRYSSGLPNLAFLKERAEYWDAMSSIYSECVRYLKPGGFFVYGIKDMTLNKKPLMLHQRFNELLADRTGLIHVGTAFLRHYPMTYHLNTYFKKWGAHPPYFQTIGVWQKPSNAACL